MERGQANRPRGSSGQRPQQHQSRPAQRPQQRRKPARRRKRSKTLYYLILFLFCLGLGITLCMTVLFKVEKIVVENNTFYSDQELISRSGIIQGDNLFRINDGDTEKMLEDRFPYIQSVEVKRRLPATILLDITEEVPTVAAYSSEGYVILSATGKVLKTKVDAPPGDIPVLLGLEEQTFTVGSYVYQLTAERERVLDDKLVLLQKFLNHCEAQALEPLTYVDINDSGELKALYDERILIDFGGEIDLEKKINFVQKVLADGIANNHPLSGYTNDNFEGTIDITDRKQLHTRALAVSTIADARAFTIFSEEEADENLEDELSEEEVLPEEDGAEEEKKDSEQ